MSITFYPTVSKGEWGKYTQELSRVMLPASSWASAEVGKYGKVRQRIPVPQLSATMVDTAADCGGFVATRKWGDYKYSAEQYVEWLDGWRPGWAATMDYCCEPPLTGGNRVVIIERQKRTTERAWWFWQHYRTASWVWVPTIQGWDITDYQRHAGELLPLIRQMSSHYGPTRGFRVGIGTLCARASSLMIQQVTAAVSTILGQVPIHLWGTKLGVFKSPVQLPASITSVDSAAFNGMWGRGREEWKHSGMSQRQWCFAVALPTYEQKLLAALSQPKQLSLEEIA